LFWGEGEWNFFSEAEWAEGTVEEYTDEIELSAFNANHPKYERLSKQLLALVVISHANWQNPKELKGQLWIDKGINHIKMGNKILSLRGKLITSRI